MLLQVLGCRHPKNSIRLDWRGHYVRTNLTDEEIADFANINTKIHSKKEKLL